VDSHEASNQPPIPLLHEAIIKVSPSVKLLSLRKSMKTIQTPRALDERQRTRTAISWIIKATEKGRTGPVRREVRIAREIISILEGESSVLDKLDDRHKTAMLARWVKLLAKANV
jgi:small subunit ribosomal protein S7